MAAETESKEKPVHRSRLAPLNATVAVIVIFFASQIVAVNLMAIIGTLLGYQDDALIDWLSSSDVIRFLLLATTAAVGLGMVATLLKWLKATWREIGLTRLKATHIGQAILGYGWYMLLYIPATILIGWLLTDVNLEQQQQLGFDRGATGIELLVIAVSLIVLPAVYEEVLVRGVLFTGLRKKLSFVGAMLAASLLFGAAHLEWLGDTPLNWAAAIDTFILSMVLIYLRENTGSLWPAIFLHGIKNFIAFIFIFVLKVTGL